MADVAVDEAASKLLFDNAVTQTEMNLASFDESSRAQARMHRALAVVKARENELGDHAPAGLRLIEKSQTAWLAYREAQMTLEWPSAQCFGGIYPMCVGMCVGMYVGMGSARLFAQRAEQLEGMLDGVNGDVRSPTWDSPHQFAGTK